MINSGELPTEGSEPRRLLFLSQHRTFASAGEALRTYEHQTETYPVQDV